MGKENVCRRTGECVHVKKVREVKSAFMVESLTLLSSPQNVPFFLCDSCWFWEGWDLFKLKGKQHEGSLMWHSGGGAEQRRGSTSHPTASRGWGLGGKPCKPPCRGSSLPGPEAARSPALICTYPYTGSCHCKGSRSGLIGHSEKAGKK